MIFLRFSGYIVHVTGDCGEHHPKGLSVADRLLQVTETSSGHVRYRFVHQLQADEGIAEIARAADAAPTLTLSEGQLRDAFLNAGVDEGTEDRF